MRLTTGPWDRPPCSCEAREEDDVPYVVDVLDGEGWSLRMERTLPEATAELPGVMVQKTSHGQGSPFVRGFTGFRSLFLVDGIRLNNSVFRDGPNQYWTTVDPLSVERLEVVKGPASVLYGSDAVGATVQALPLRPPLLASDGDLAARFHYRFASAEDSHVGRVAVGGRGGERLRFTAGASFKGFGDVDAGGDVGVQPRTGYDESDADLRAELDLGDRRQLVLGVQHVEMDDAWRTHSTVFAVPWRGTEAGGDLRRSLDQRRTLAYLQLHRPTRWGSAAAGRGAPSRSRSSTPTSTTSSSALPPAASSTAPSR